MFKNYLSYSLALGFHRSCCALDLASPRKERLVRSSETLIHHFALAVHTKDSKEESRTLAVALIALRDCLESLDELGVAPQHEVRSQYTTLHGRLEQLVEKAADKEGGQLRMLG
jgi:hypothetical protein